MKPIQTLDDWAACLAVSDQHPVFVFKHSTRCPISAAAEQRVAAYLKTAPAEVAPFYLVKVIESRPVSTAISETLSVKHESPQIILIKGGKAVWSQSHHEITGQGIEQAISSWIDPLEG